MPNSSIQSAINSNIHSLLITGATTSPPPSTISLPALHEAKSRTTQQHVLPILLQEQSIHPDLLRLPVRIRARTHPHRPADPTPLLHRHRSTHQPTPKPTRVLPPYNPPLQRPLSSITTRLSPFRPKLIPPPSHARHPERRGQRRLRGSARLGHRDYMAAAER